MAPDAKRIGASVARLRAGRFLFGHGLFDRGQRRVRPGAVRSTGLRHVGPSAAALAAERRRSELDELNRAEARGQIGGHADHDAGLAVLGDADDGDHARSDLLLAFVNEALEILGLDARDRSRQQLDVADLAHASGSLSTIAAATAAHRELLARIR